MLSLFLGSRVAVEMVSSILAVNVKDRMGVPSKCTIIMTIECEPAYVWRRQVEGKRRIETKPNKV
jgi:hypothetical protein